MLNIFSGLALYFLFRRTKKGATQANPWTGISHALFFLSLCFFGLTLYSIDLQLGQPLGWKAIIVLTSLGGMAMAYGFTIPSVLTISVLGLSGWWTIEAAAWAQASKSWGLLLIIGLLLVVSLLYILGWIHEKIRPVKELAFPYTVLGTLGLGFFLFFFSTQDGMRTLQQAVDRQNANLPLFITISLSIYALGLLGAVVYGLIKRSLATHEAGVGLIGLVVSMLLIIFPPRVLFDEAVNTRVWRSSQLLSPAGMWWAGFLSVLLFTFILSIIFSGYVRKREGLVNTGTVLLFIFILTKYFDWFFDFLDKSIFFIGAGIILFGVGIGLERGRRYVVRAFDYDKTT